MLVVVMTVNSGRWTVDYQKGPRWASQNGKMETKKERRMTELVIRIPD